MAGVAVDTVQDAAADAAGCSRILGLVVEPTAERSTEICAAVAELPASRDSHVVVTRSNPVELYIDNSRHDFLLIFTGKCQSFLSFAIFHHHI